MKYFAYGSNMTLNRLKVRTPSAYQLGVFALKGHTLKFHKIGKDGSAKCNAHLTGFDIDVVQGVVFEIDRSEVAILDRIEGLGEGYEKKTVKVSNAQGYNVETFSYFATRINDCLLPFSWYKKHVLEGARGAGLNDTYISKIKSVKTISDPDSAREQRELMIHG